MRKKKATKIFTETPDMYTHPSGYKFKLRFYPSGIWGGNPHHMSVYLDSVKGANDDKLKFPARFTITLELLNQHRDQDHYSRDIQCEMKKGQTSLGIESKLVHENALGWNAVKQTQYLKNNCLKFRVTKINIL